MTSPTPNLLLPSEVAEVLRVSKMTVYRLIKSGTLPAVRIGRSFRIPQASFEEYLRQASSQSGD